jgi:hypothetical protein
MGASGMSFTASDIQWEIEPLSFHDTTWGFNIRYWLGKEKADATYYSFPETFPTKQAMMDCALKVAPQYLAAHFPILLSAVAELTPSRP